MDSAVFVIVLVIVSLLLVIFTRRQQDGRPPSLRPLTACTTLANQIGEAIESGRQLHISLGQAGLTGTAMPTSAATVPVLDYLAADGCASGTPPLATVGEGTLLPVAQDSLRQAYTQAGRKSEYKPSMAQFIAHESDSYAFAGGIASVIQRREASGSVLVGHYGPEIAIAAEAAARQNMTQVIGTDDPTALAIAAAFTENVLIGEELFAAGTYLEGSPSQLASLLVQDILRALIIVIILGLAIYQLLAG